ncbi:MAG: hypothetical protein JXN64_07005 [Spirochaetes bacterium]|nr:hypothetical protein [Spirochaetota bacterium]
MISLYAPNRITSKNPKYTVIAPVQNSRNRLPGFFKKQRKSQYPTIVGQLTIPSGEYNKALRKTGSSTQ